jgi:hypothetical protein
VPVLSAVATEKFEMIIYIPAGRQSDKNRHPDDIYCRFIPVVGLVDLSNYQKLKII